MSVALRHVGIVVSNLDEALAIYTNYLGCELKDFHPDVNGTYISELVGIQDAKMKIAILKTEDDNRIELIEYISNIGKPRTPVLSNDIGISHFALTVKNIQNLYDNRMNFNIKFLSPPLLSPNGFVKVAYAIILNESLVELVEVIHEKGRITGSK